MDALRDRYNAFIARHEAAWELGFAGLAILFVIVGFTGQSFVAFDLELVLTAVFAVEFGSRLAAARDRRGYLRGHWIDLLALIPTGRGLRVLRLVRLLRLVRAFAGLYRALVTVEAIARHRGLAFLLAAWAAVMVTCSLALYAAEQGVNNAIDSPLDALWWGIVTLTTVGYGDVYPITPEGRLAATVLMVLGIGLFSAITAILTSVLLREPAAPARSPADRLRELDGLRVAGSVSEDEYGAIRGRILTEL